MADKQDIHQFATKYLQMYRDPNPPRTPLLTSFGEDARALGFQTDLGESFMRAYSGDAFYEADEFSAVASRIEDPYLLGTAIYSRWRLVTQWEENNLLMDDKRAWFQAALGRLAELTAEDDVEDAAFIGNIERILLVSNNVEGIPGSAMATGMEQRVTLTAAGDLSTAVTRFNAGPSGHNLISRPPSIKIGHDDAGRILAAIQTAFPHLPPGETAASGLAAAPGTWNLIATNEWGRPYRTSGDLGVRIIVGGSDLSDLIRGVAQNDDLLLFDGNPDLVMRLEIKYRRGVPAAKDDPDADGGVKWVYYEQVVFDRRSETMEHFLDAGPAHRSRTSSHVSGAVSDFLDSLDARHDFSEPVGNPPDTVYPKTEVASYQIAIKTKYGNTRVIHGTYDARSLPEEWGAFIDHMLAFMGFFGYGELFDEGRYGRALRRESDYVYALVEPEDGTEPSWFLSSDPEIKDADIVLVPGDGRGDMQTGQVRQVVYGSRADAPEPFSSLGRILRTPGQTGVLG